MRRARGLKYFGLVGIMMIHVEIRESRRVK